MRVQNSDLRQSLVSALLFGISLFLTLSASAAPVGESDVPTVKAAPQPHSIEQEISLANDYFVGRGVAQDFQQSAYWFEKAAEAGDASAQMQIGYFYDAGIGVSRNPERAAHWYQLAAAGGLANAKLNLGILYFYGVGVHKNQELGVKLIREAAESGSGRAAGYLGNMYYFALGVPQDRVTAERWYQKAAKLGDPRAENELALLFFSGQDRSQDQRIAAKLLRESATAGYVLAMHALGLLLLRNPALAKSPDEAVGLLNDSASAGSWKSSVLLGVLARDGKGVPVDASSAYYHFRVAVLQGKEEAKKLLVTDLQNLSSRLGPDQTASLDSKAENWYQQHRIELEFVSRGAENRTGFSDYALAVPENGSHTVQILPGQPN